MRRITWLVVWRWPNVGESVGEALAEHSLNAGKYGINVRLALGGGGGDSRIPGVRIFSLFHAKNRNVAPIQRLQALW